MRGFRVDGLFAAASWKTALCSVLLVVEDLSREGADFLCIRIAGGFCLMELPTFSLRLRLIVEFLYRS